MASHNTSHATGADHDANELRRRNVPTYGGSNGDIIKDSESPDYEKKAKKVRKFRWSYQGARGRRNSGIVTSYMLT